MAVSENGAPTVENEAAGGNWPSVLTSAKSIPPRRITAIYLGFGLGALFLSDLVFLVLLNDPVLRWMQAGKGLLEIVLTAGLIYLLTTTSQRSLRRSNDELERHREELDVLHRILRHNLRNDLTVIRGQAEALQDAVDETNESTCRSMLDATDDVIADTERVQAIRKLTERGRQRVDLATLIPTVVSEATRDLDGVEIEATVPESAPVVANEHLDRALLELLTNAKLHAGERAFVEIRVDPDCDRHGMTLIEVSDDGPGLPEHTVAVIREKERDQLVHLEGLGLWFAYLTVVESDGEFVLPSTESGTTIGMYLPTVTEERGTVDRIRSRIGRD